MKKIFFTSTLILAFAIMAHPQDKVKSTKKESTKKDAGTKTKIDGTKSSTIAGGDGKKPGTPHPPPPPPKNDIK